MLAEKFFLYLEALIKDRCYGTPTHTDGAPRVTSASPHVPVVLPAQTSRRGVST
jgi:hypothetical protein